MARVLFFLLTGLISLASQAGEISCYGEIDPGAGYTVTAVFDRDLHISGEMQIRYEDNSGFTFTAITKPTDFEIKRGESLKVKGPFQGGAMTLAAAYDAASETYQGLLVANGSAGEGFMVDLICRIDFDT